MRCPARRFKLPYNAVAMIWSDEKYLKAKSGWTDCNKNLTCMKKSKDMKDFIRDTSSPDSVGVSKSNLTDQKMFSWFHHKP